MNLIDYLNQQPEITREFEIDQLELVLTIQSAAEGGGVRKCNMGRGRGTTTILLLARKWLVMEKRFRAPIMVAPNGFPSLEIRSVHCLRGLQIGPEHLRPDFYLVDFHTDRSEYRQRANMQALQRLNIQSGVLVNV